MATREQLLEMNEAIIACALAVHTQLGPGLLESTYETCLAYELQARGLTVEQQKPVPLVYKEIRLETAYRLDLLVADSVIVEVKSVDELLPVHKAQLADLSQALSPTRWAAHQFQCAIPERWHPPRSE